MKIYQTAQKVPTRIKTDHKALHHKSLSSASGKNIFSILNYRVPKSEGEAKQVLGKEFRWEPPSQILQHRVGWGTRLGTP